MTKFTVPLGWFEIHLAESVVRESAKTLQDAMVELRTLMETGFGNDSDDLQGQARALDSITEGSVLRKVEAASQQFRRSLEVSEFPPDIPHITHQLIYASIVAQVFSLSFEILHYELDVNHEGRRHWAVSGRALTGMVGNLNAKGSVSCSRRMMRG